MPFSGTPQVTDYDISTASRCDGDFLQTVLEDVKFEMQYEYQ